MPEEYKKLKNELFSAKLFKKINSIKEGEFPKIFKNETPEETEGTYPMKIPKEQITAFEKNKKKAAVFKTQQKAMKTEEESVKKLEKQAKLTGIDEILAIRRELSGKTTNKTEKELGSNDKRLHTSATAKITEGKLKAWVDHCYNFVHGGRGISEDADNRTRSETKIRELLEWDRLPLGIDDVPVNKETRGSESSGSLDREPSSVEAERSSSEETERILRVKAGAPELNKELEDNKVYESQSEMELRAKSGVNFVLSDYFVRNLQELKSLIFNEELYAFHPQLGIIGSWRVDTKLCETDNKRVNVQFEGLIINGSSNYAMYSAGVVDRKFNPITEFRVEQVTNPNETRSRTLFFHKKRNKWLFDLREGINETETRKTLSLNYQQMMRVVSESVHILLMRKIVMYYHPFHFDEVLGETEGYNKHTFCPCSDISKICTCKAAYQYSKRTRFTLKMRSLCIDGEVCRTNYRFFKPVRIKYNGVDLEVVRVRRRIEMPGNLIQSSNYYMTTAGQLMAVTFNDPYPFDTPIWLQIDPKAVLQRHQIVSPERIVPLRERYMCDPELKQFYEDEVERFIAINKSYLRNHPPLRNAIKAIFQDLLNDKPHRVVAFIQDFFLEGYRFKERCGNCDSGLPSSASN